VRTFAIGDVHGHLALLLDLLGQIDGLAAGEPHRIVCLGDYIDRGPDSAGVVRFLRDLQAERGREAVVCLKGNHEDMLLRARRGDPIGWAWLDNGGYECLTSFGVDSAADIAESVVDWIEACPSFFEDDRRYYVHAGLDPDRGRHDQRDEDRLWIRSRFLDRNHDFGRFVVHGHTPQENGLPDLHPYRVNLDTGAAYGGPLTAAVFAEGRPDPVSFLRAYPCR